MTAPQITYAVLSKSLSRNRLATYSITADLDSSDAVARYLWNLALSAAMQPVVHTLEISFRNALFDVGNEAAAKSPFATRIVPSWLDAKPSMLASQEEADVTKAVQRLGRNSKRHTAGHLVGHLSFGFWIRLCNSPYEQGRPNGPALWPLAAKRFPNCPRTERTRERIRDAFDEVREFRNRMAHHQPIWDTSVLAMHDQAIEQIRWMNAKLAAVTQHYSQLAAVFNAGPAAWRHIAESSFVVAD